MPGLSIRLAAVAAAATALATVPVAHAAPVSREVSASYTAPGGAQLGATVSVGGQGGALGAATLPTRAGERAVTLRVSDDSGRPIAAEVVQVLDEQTGAFVQLGELCGPAAHTFRLQRSQAPVTVRPLIGACATEPSLPTTGTVHAVFRR